MANTKTFKSKGFPESSRLIRLIGQRAFQSGVKFLFLEGERIIGDSKENYVPVDFGTLRNSGFVEPPKVSGRKVKVRCGFGGPAAPYALSVHENPRAGKTGGVSPSGRKYQHWAQTGEWKYLEKPFNAALGTMDARMAQHIRSELKL
jgi:hypothetical protein